MITHIVITESRKAILENKRTFKSYDEAFDYYKEFDPYVKIVTTLDFEELINLNDIDLTNIIFISISPYSEEMDDDIKEESKQLVETLFGYL